MTCLRNFSGMGSLLKLEWTNCLPLEEKKSGLSLPNIELYNIVFDMGKLVWVRSHSMEHSFTSPQEEYRALTQKGLLIPY